jgi:hypothetical protein
MLPLKSHIALDLFLAGRGGRIYLHACSLRRDAAR